MCSIYSK